MVKIGDRIRCLTITKLTKTIQNLWSQGGLNRQHLRADLQAGGLRRALAPAVDSIRTFGSNKKGAVAGEITRNSEATFEDR